MTVQTEESMKAHADHAGKMLNASLPESVGYVLVVSDGAGGIVVWNTNLDLAREAATLFRDLAEDIEKNGLPPLGPIDG